ncbi:MAG TPA: copper amine oxidase N-terminal domain-containing protein [Defluviitaleaceae bacterium]|nr:copper amine oxidase N-terminal domain-containing protein [Defluviitaleaceae bacterium]
MKKFAVVIVIALFMTGFFSVWNVFGDMPLRIVVDGDRLFFPDAQPFIDSNGRTQVPARFIGERLGATVTWDGAAQKAVFVKGNKKLVLYIGKKEYELDGKILQMDTAALLHEDRTYVPARYVAEAFGATVRWDSVIKTVYIDTESRVLPTPQATKDPVYGWIKVETDVVDVEYGISITFTSDQELMKARLDAAEKMFAEVYGEDIAKEVFEYVRKKKTVSDVVPLKKFTNGSKIVTAKAGGVGIMVQVWKEGVVLQ